MLKITRIADTDAKVTFKLEGKLVDAWVEEFRQACEEATVPTQGLKLNLSALTYIDAAGTCLLRDLLKRGITISAASHFVSHMLYREN
jgi:anti-anti-sigma regulatory factor